jgi:hypothetical protein
LAAGNVSRILGTRISTLPALGHTVKTTCPPP